MMIVVLEEESYRLSVFRLSGGGQGDNRKTDNRYRCFPDPAQPQNPRPGAVVREPERRDNAIIGHALPVLQHPTETLKNP